MNARRLLTWLASEALNCVGGLRLRACGKRAESRRSTAGWTCALVDAGRVADEVERVGALRERAARERRA